MGRRQITVAKHDSLWSAEVVDTALSKVPAQHVVAFRTHHEPSKNIAAAIEKGQAKVQICVRDPRDLALSMWDVLKQQRAKGRDRPHLTSLSGMLEHIERNLRYTHKWADLGAPLILNYEQTAFSPEVSLSAISNDVGLIVDSSSFGTIFSDVTSTKNAAQNRNVAKPYRHRREMELSVQEVFLERFQAYYERFLPGSTAVSEAVLKNAAVG